MAGGGGMAGGGMAGGGNGMLALLAGAWERNQNAVPAPAAISMQAAAIASQGQPRVGFAATTLVAELLSRFMRLRSA